MLVVSGPILSTIRLSAFNSLRHDRWISYQLVVAGLVRWTRMVID